MENTEKLKVENICISFTQIVIILKTTTTTGKKHRLGFPGGSEVKNPPANAGDSLNSGPGTFHMLQSSKALVPQRLSPHPRTSALQHEKPP